MIIWSNCLTASGLTKLKHVARGTVQMPRKHGQAWGIDHLSGKPVPVFDHPLAKEMLPTVQSKPPLAQLWTIPTCPVTGYQGEELSTSLSTSSGSCGEQ